MGITAVVLDSTPLGLVTQKTGKSSEADACRAWMENLLNQGVDVYVPEIADYELRREMVRAGLTNSILRLDKLKTFLHYLPLTTPIMHHAADLWAYARKAGIPTADQHALDGDVIVCAQTLSVGLAAPDVVVVTSNVNHLSRFVQADLWQNI